MRSFNPRRYRTDLVMTIIACALIVGGLWIWAQFGGGPFAR